MGKRQNRGPISVKAERPGGVGLRRPCGRLGAGDAPALLNGYSSEASKWPARVRERARCFRMCAARYSLLPKMLPSRPLNGEPSPVMLAMTSCTAPFSIRPERCSLRSPPFSCT